MSVEESATAIDAGALVLASTGIERPPPNMSAWAIVIALGIAVTAAIYWAVTQTPLVHNLLR